AHGERQMAAKISAPAEAARGAGHPRTAGATEGDVSLKPKSKKPAKSGFFYTHYASSEGYLSAKRYFLLPAKYSFINLFIFIIYLIS
ncbi:hypothetical protein M8368_28765, partial [Enterobacter kobei]|nr:hypothetical protein [Enterobacter kobei]